MVFSKEEREIWARSEVMQELERIAKKQNLEIPDDAFLPISEAHDWEDELSDEEKLVDALKEFEKEDEDIKNQREKEVEFNEEKIMPVPEHEKELSNEQVESTLDPADEDYIDNLEKEEEKEKMRQFDEGEVRPWDWRGTIGPAEIEANLIAGLTKLASDLGNQGKVVEASKVEDTIRDIRIALREANNG